MPTKEMHYCFPTSDGAKERGYYNEGCYVIEVGGLADDVFPTKQKQEAIKYYDSIDCEPGKWCLVNYWRKKGDKCFG